MKITAQLPGVNRPLSVELRLMTFVPAILDSQEENHTAPGQSLLTKRSDFPGAEGLVRCSPFGGGRIRHVMNQCDGPSRFQPTILENACLGRGSLVGKSRS